MQDKDPLREGKAKRDALISHKAIQFQYYLDWYFDKAKKVINIAILSTS